MKLKDLGAGAALMLGAAAMTVALFASFYLGVRFGQGTPAATPPKQGIVRSAITLKILSSEEWAVVTIYDIGQGKVFVSSEWVPEPE